jgi:protein gp37
LRNEANERSECTLRIECTEHKTALTGCGGNCGKLRRAIYPMAETSIIEWTRSTFNPWIGCTRVSPGCDHCYAERMDARGIYGGARHWGPGVPRYRTGDTNWNQVRRWNRRAAQNGEFWPVFTASQADIFDNEVPDDWRDDYWSLVRDCPHLTFQIVTKRIGNVPRMLPPDWTDAGYPNVWLLITVVTQEEAARDIPKLLRIPAVIRGLSMEPLLEAVDLASASGITPSANRMRGGGRPGIDWVICGGESGPGARPAHPQWLRSLRDQCREGGTAFFFKQWGEYAPVDAGDADTGSRIVLDDGQAMRRFGKKVSGRMLDGCTWDELPQVRR